MDISAITRASLLNNTEGVNSITGSLFPKTEEANGTVFESFLNTAIDNINTTNSYLSDAENEEIRFALGETEIPMIWLLRCRKHLRHFNTRWLSETDCWKATERL